MDERRKGEIALTLLRSWIRWKGIRLTLGLKRDLGNVAKTTGIPLSELKEFGRELLNELTAEIFK